MNIKAQCFESVCIIPLGDKTRIIIGRKKPWLLVIVALLLVMLLIFLSTLTILHFSGENLSLFLRFAILFQGICASLSSLHSFFIVKSNYEYYTRAYRGLYSSSDLPSVLISSRWFLSSIIMEAALGLAVFIILSGKLSLSMSLVGILLFIILFIGILLGISSYSLLYLLLFVLWTYFRYRQELVIDKNLNIIHIKGKWIGRPTKELIVCTPKARMLKNCRYADSIYISTHPLVKGKFDLFLRLREEEQRFVHIIAANERELIAIISALEEAYPFDVIISHTDFTPILIIRDAKPEKILAGLLEVQKS